MAGVLKDHIPSTPPPYFLLIKTPSRKAYKVKSGADKYFKNKYYKLK